MNELIVSNEEFNLLYQSKTIYIPGNFISSEVIKRILEDETYYDYTVLFFNDEIDSFKIIDEDKKHLFNYQKREIITAMEIYLKNNNITDPNIINKYNNLKEAISFNRLKDNYYNKLLDIDIDQIHYQINIKDIINILEMSNNEFRELLNNSEINGIKKEYFVYAIKTFIDNNMILDNYYLVDNVKNNIIDINNYYVDIESLNTFLETEDTLYQKVELSKDLEEYIFNSIPSEFNLLEKSIYIYIMLCRTHYYNEEFHAFNEESDKFSDYHDINKISLDNNSVTCYQFNLIYSIFLHKLGINFKSNYLVNGNEEGYGKGHVNLKYRVGKYLIFADATERIFEGDMINAKIFDPIISIRSYNKNSDTKNEFNYSLNKVYDYIKKKYNYKPVNVNIGSLSIKDRLNVIINELNKRNLNGVELMGYILRLRKMYFTEDERMDNIKINIIANTNTSDDRLAKLLAIIRLDNKFYLYEAKEELKEISFDEINEKFMNGEFSYLETDCNLIPNIERKK